jgi:hypothetical protein
LESIGKEQAMVKMLGVLLLSLMLTTASVIDGQGNDVRTFCNLRAPQQTRVFDWSTWQTAYVQDPNVSVEPFQWDASRTLWRGYQSAQPFDQPSDAFKHWSVTLIGADGSEQWIYLFDSVQTPDTFYVYVFDNVQPFADNQGNHYGIHPCRAFAADANSVDNWLNQVY